MEQKFYVRNIRKVQLHVQSNNGSNRIRENVSIFFLVGYRGYWSTFIVIFSFIIPGFVVQ